MDRMKSAGHRLGHPAAGRRRRRQSGVSSPAGSGHLTFRRAENGVVKTLDVELVGRFQDNIRKTACPNPLDHIDQPLPHGVRIAQDLVLSLIKATEDNSNTLTVARLDHPAHADTAKTVRLRGADGTHTGNPPWRHSVNARTPHAA
jgi:hypothetical protein